jgi:hypothetical protein
MWMPCEWYIQDLDAKRRTMCTKSYFACMPPQAQNYHASMLPPHCHCTPMLWPCDTATNKVKEPLANGETHAKLLVQESEHASLLSSRFQHCSFFCGEISTRCCMSSCISCSLLIEHATSYV